jgi:DNA-directed RNA polymerase subunit E'/Rpb7
MSSPYITTVLYASVTLLPSQMDNNIYNHLKKNLVNRLSNKCYRNYGYISKIYQILDRSNGNIIAENPMAAATYKVKFSCRLCNPLRKKQIICKVDKINKILIIASNGPIKIVITMDRINNNNFFQDKKTGVLLSKTDNKSVPITLGTYVKITVHSKIFNDMDNVIMALGYLEGVANETEVKQFYSDEYDTEQGKIIDYEEYSKQERDLDQVGENKGDNEEDNEQKMES